MKKPKIILHNAVSLDGSLTGFDFDMGAYYGALMSYRPDFILVGSETARKGIDLFMKSVPKETEKDRRKPKTVPGDTRPSWVLVDSTGKMKELLHVFRGQEYCRDVIVAISDKTPESYVRYLEERSYGYIRTPSSDKAGHADLAILVETLRKDYGAKTIVTDTGGTLDCAMLDRGLIDEISLVIVPGIMGGKDGERLPIFGRLEKSMKNMKLKKAEKLEGGLLHVVYSTI